MGFVNYRQDTNTGFGRDLAPAPQNDPKLFEPVRCRVIRAFYISGKPAQPGDDVEIERHLFESLQAIGKVELIK